MHKEKYLDTSFQYLTYEFSMLKVQNRVRVQKIFFDSYPQPISSHKTLNQSIE
jgi:hypothetical protein